MSTYGPPKKWVGRRHRWKASNPKMQYPDWTCTLCGARISGMETACKPSSDCRVGNNQVDGLRHVPQPAPIAGVDPYDQMLTCDEVIVALVMLS